MLTISLVQVNFQQGPTSCNAFYLPYTVGCLWAYANTFEHVQKNYQLEHIIWRRDDVTTTAEKLAKQDVVIVSCYVWNRNWNYALAQRIKEINPRCLILFGGPEMAVTKKDVFHQHPEIDVIIKGEGEETFKNFLLNIHDLESVPGLLINRNGEVVDTGDAERIQDLDSLPSPYLTGFFDDIVRDNPGVEWNGTLETNRGCPYQCTFCDWGSLTYTKVKKFPLEKVFAEMEWIARHKCGAIVVCDANFGMFVERDNLIIDRFIELQKQYGYPYLWQVSWAKNQKKEVIEIIKKLTSNTQAFNQGLTLSIQSLDENVLTNIKRKNMHDINLSETYRQAEKNQIPVFTEMILGLPGETLNSWQENFYKLLRLDIHSNIEITISQLLENAEMNLVQRQIYDIKTIQVFDYVGGGYNIDAWPESIEVTRSTADMSQEDIVEGLVFAWFFVTFHSHGFSNFVSRFLHKHQGIDYRVFYEQLWQRLQYDPWFKNKFMQIRKGFTDWLDHGHPRWPVIAGVTINSWTVFHATAMEIHQNNLYDMTFDIIEDLVNTLALDQDLAQDVMKLQRNYVVNLHELDQYPRRASFNHNVYDFIINDAKLNKGLNQMEFDFTFGKDIKFDTHIERIFYARRMNYGRAKIKQHENQYA
jgi:radical SAM superfamily enzyme YgiQ (UPF0313 family)